mgnify:CR=1 FL=1
MHGRTFGNGLETRRLDGEAFSSRNLPDRGTFHAEKMIMSFLKNLTGEKQILTFYLSLLTNTLG